MNADDKKHAENLRHALHALHHSGPDGFEGYLAVVLGQLTGQTYRLAKSGTQRGRDGDSAFDAGEIFFEGKRYNSSPGKAEIAAKLLDLAIDDAGQVDLWVLGATCEIAAQTVNDARIFATKLGIGIVTLDWSDNDLGALLVATVVAGSGAKTFIENGLRLIKQSQLISGAFAAIDHFSTHSNLTTRSDSLRQSLSREDVGLEHAKTLNRTWMRKRFLSKAYARAEFGQFLAPLDASGLVAVARAEQSQLISAFKGSPTGQLYAVVGEEGVGKSWICAKTWIDETPCSLLIICPADDLLGLGAAGDFETYLIQKLILQTGSQQSEQVNRRWRRRLKGWRANPSPDNVRVTLVFDGLNQPRKTDWSRWLDQAANELHEMGGSLVVTTRSAHWTQLKRTLSSEVTTIKIGEWSNQEVKSHLRDRGIAPEKVSETVLNSLRNPRIFGIAVDLLEANDVEAISELSVGRLIFEHMRRAQSTGAAPMHGEEFADLLRCLGHEILNRTKAQERDDLRVFDATRRHELQAVATSRFFVPVTGAPLQYEIRPEGLNLGLALFLNRELEKEYRNQRDPKEWLVANLEPISALDEVGNIVFLATQIACIETDASNDARSALIEHFLSLQNAPTNEVDAFSVLLKSAPSAFLAATENVHCSDVHVPNADWLLYSLLKHRDSPTVWPGISAHFKRWLSFYSLAPERMMFRAIGRDSVDEVNKERAEKILRIEEKTTHLTAEERAFVDAHLVAVDRWDFNKLHQIVFYVLAGRPLQEFAHHFVRWSLSDAYGPAIHSPDKEFRQLIRFNRLDWTTTRSSLMGELSQLNEDRTSSVGKWARVEILRATGAADDAREAERLANWLTRDREPFVGWSRLQDYCSVDPCDPDSPTPDNVAETAARYLEIDPSELATGMGMGPADHVLDMARSGVVRFHKADAQTVHRAFAEDILARQNFPRRQGVIGLLEHSSVLTNEQAQRFLSAGQSSIVTYDRDNPAGRDGWLTSQYSVWVAISHLAPDDQLDAIASVHGAPIILDPIRAIRMPSEHKVEQVLARVLHEERPSAQSAILAAIRYTKPGLTFQAQQIVAALCKSTDAGVRGEALGVATALSGKVWLKEFADSGWSASGKDFLERWYGSLAIQKAAKAGLIPIADTLDRLHLDHYGFAAAELGPECARLVAVRVDAALIKALNYRGIAELPEITTTIPSSINFGPPRISLADPPPKDHRERLHQFGESSEQFYQRQTRMWNAFEKFSAELTAGDAELILSDLTFNGVKAILAAGPEYGKRWLPLLLAASDGRLRLVHHIAIQIAIILVAKHEPDASVLLDRVIQLDPTVRRVSGPAKITHEATLLWANADAPLIESMCRQRLITRRNDAEISLEVLAAHVSGMDRIVRQVTDELVAKGDPADLCLALTLAGFSETSDHATSLIAQYETTQGYIGIAQRAAKAAYQKNVWAKSWYLSMLAATDRTDFWRASVLLIKIVDARFEIWQRALGTKGEVFAAFESTVDSAIRRRIEKRQGKRKDTLFGDKAPADYFLPG